MPKKTKKGKSTKSGKKQSSRKNLFKGILTLVIVLMIGGLAIGYKYYNLIYLTNVNLGSKETVYIYIPTNSGFDAVKNILYKENYIINKASFEWLCEKKGYNLKVRSGRYLLKNHMSNNELINMLRSGKQVPVRLTFNNIRTKQQFAGRIGKLIEADSLSLMTLLLNENFLKKFDLDTNNVMCVFIPDTYEIFWDTPAEKFFEKMYDHYQKFWNQSRKQKAADMRLTPEEVVILASIVYQETKKKDEMSRIAGVYLNRIHRKIPLQADPTIIFALGDFSIKRLLNYQLEIESPYNTYKYIGLPPGPICLPEAIVVDKVLDYEKHDYIYFCAKEDFSGYHNFAETAAQHAVNALKYHNALNNLKIKK
jgi:UPF0755 protein